MKRALATILLTLVVAALVGPSIQLGGSSARADVSTLAGGVSATLHQNIVYRGLGASTVRPRMLFTFGDTAYAKIVVTDLDDGDWVISALYQNTMRTRLNDSTATSFWSDITDSTYVSADTLQFHVDTDSGTVILLIHDNNY